MDSLNSAAGKCPYRLQNALIDGATFLLHFLFEIGMKKGLRKVFIDKIQIMVVYISQLIKFDYH